MVSDDWPEQPKKNFYQLTEEKWVAEAVELIKQRDYAPAIVLLKALLILKDYANTEKSL